MTADAYDILVVGAGPAGASAAAEAALRKMRVLVVERRSAVGVPIQCAEYIPKQLLGELDIAKRYIVQPVRGLKTYLENQLVKETPAQGFIIRRDYFDRLLIEKAVQNGARLELSTKALERNGDRILVQSKSCPPQTITARVIIGTDGPLSTVASWFDRRIESLIAAVQVRVSLVNRIDFAHVYFKPAFFGGYAWLFPRGADANVGLGLKKKKDSPFSPGHLLEQFLQQHFREGMIKTNISHRISGWIPAGLRNNIVHENIMLAGDAAGQTHPITGAGIFPAVTCGRMAGKWAAEAVGSNDLSLLVQYEQEYKDLFGDAMQRASERRRLLEANWDRLEETLKQCWVAFRGYYAAT